MTRYLFASVFALAAVVRGAEVASPATSSASENKNLDTTVAESPATETKAKRAVSPDTAAKLSAAASKLAVPPEPSPPPPPPDVAPVAVARENGDRPRNQIVRLPQFIVGEPKLHTPLNELKVLTPKGRVEYAMARRPGLRFGPFASLNGPIAIEMLEDDLLAQRRREEAELWSLYLVREAPAENVRVTQVSQP
jgi:hypothetical protein